MITRKKRIDVPGVRLLERAMDVLDGDIEVTLLLVLTSDKPQMIDTAYRHRTMSRSPQDGH